MLADPTLLRKSPTDPVPFDLLAFQNAVRRGTAFPISSSTKEEAGRLGLLEYAAFVLEQEACYCQQ